MIALRTASDADVDPSGGAHGGVLVSRPGTGRAVVPDPDGAVAALLRLLRTPVAWEPLIEKAAELAPDADPGGLAARVARLLGVGLVVAVCVADDGAEAAEARLTSRLGHYRPGSEPLPGARLRLSRFAAVRRDGDTAVLESPAAACQVILNRPALAALPAALAVPRTPAEALAHCPDPAAADLLQLLVDLGLAAETDAAGGLPEDEAPGHAGRTFRDLWAHGGRAGIAMSPPRAGGPSTAFPPPPALTPADGPVRPLPRPDMARLRRTDPPLAEVMERRRSVRTFGDPPVTAAQVGEVLYRVGRITTRLAADPDTPGSYDRALRPVPGAGALHELEYYVAARRCTGLSPGVYRYDPADHALVTVARDPSALVPLVDHAYRALGSSDVPQVLITLAARFQRLSWKYGEIAHTLALKDTGVVIQSVYLCAEAAGLAACAIGPADTAAFAEATGCDPLDQAPVGGIVLGSRPAP
ncbi:SagB family peptide dehydrogenase [Nocardiopsis sp. NPDC049922]|uniref:SagB family peptide dehydrogenase n=1 Tax=Nocardiopsis sp. NPDC049922 TaxID=3155157 RepID=UPI0033C66AD1